MQFSYDTRIPSKKGTKMITKEDIQKIMEALQEIKELNIETAILLPDANSPAEILIDNRKPEDIQ